VLTAALPAIDEAELPATGVVYRFHDE